VTMMAVGAGAQSRVEGQIRSLGSNLIIVLSGSITTGGVRLGAGSQLTVSEDDARAMEREIDSIQVAAPTVRGGVQVIAGNANWSTALFGVTPAFLEARDWETAVGRPLTQDDVDGATKVVLLGQTVASNLFGGADPIGQVVRVKKVPLTVVGVLARKGQSTQGQDQDDTILVPLSTAKKKVLGTSQANARAVNAILVKIREPGAMKGAEQNIRTLLRQRHHLQPGQDDDFTLRNLAEILESQEASSRVLSLLLAAIASVSLVVGGIGIMNIMLVSVTERTREIGLRRAVGARRRDILTQFLIEAVTVSLAGGLIGIAVGVAGAWGIGYFAGWLAPIQARAVVPAFLFAGAVGVFFGFYPARKASRLNPIDALRYE
jgi:putative ABC transport system permease protein